MKYKYKDLVQINTVFFRDYFKANPINYGVIIDVRSTGKYAADRDDVAYEYLVSMPGSSNDYWVHETNLVPGKIYMSKS